MAETALRSQLNLPNLYQQLLELEINARGLKDSLKSVLSTSNFVPIQTLYGVAKWASTEAAVTFEEDIKKIRTNWLNEWK